MSQRQILLCFLFGSILGPVRAGSAGMAGQFVGAVGGGTPGAPTLVSPAHTSGVESSQIVFTWDTTGVGPASSYHLQVGMAPGFSILLAEDSLILGVSKTLSSLPPAAMYSWRVRARGPSGDGPWSETFEFAWIPPSASSVIQVSGTTVPFSTIVGTPSEPQSYVVSGTDLSANIIIQAPEGFEIRGSTSEPYSAEVTLVPVQGSVIMTEIQVRLAGLVQGDFSGAVIHTSANAAMQSLLVSGRVSSAGGTGGGIGDGPSVNSFAFTTLTIPAQIPAIDAPTASLAAVVDGQHRTHIAWIRDVDSVSSIMYTVVDGQSATTVEIPAPRSTPKEMKAAPSIVLDGNSNPHIVYFVERVRGTSTASGNAAVMYAGDQDGDGSFDVDQVSTNSTDPSDNSENIYHAYVNGRPSISIGNGTVEVSYYSAPSSLTSYEKYAIAATRTAGGWVRQQAFIVSSMSPTIDVTLPTRTSSAHHRVWFDLSYNPRYTYRDGAWNTVTIPGQGSTGLGGTRHAQIEVANDGTTYFLWFNRSTGVNRFHYTTLTGGSYGPVLADSSINAQSSNFYPATVDPVNGRPFFAYYRNAAHWIIVDSAGTRIERQLTTLGGFYGKRILNVRNGFISYVTASQSNGAIYVTTNDAGATTVAGGMQDVPAAYVLGQNYPNPFNPSTTIQFGFPTVSSVRLEVFNMLGQQVAVLQDGMLQPGLHRVTWEPSAATGLYVYRIQVRPLDGSKEQFVQVKRMVFMK